MQIYRCYLTKLHSDLLYNPSELQHVSEIKQILLFLDYFMSIIGKGMKMSTHKF